MYQDYLTTPYHQKILTAHREERDVEVAWNYLRDTEGSVAGFMSVLTDITDRKQAEEKLHRIEWLLKKSIKPKTFQKIDEEYREQSYGKLTELNTCRVLLDALTEDMLANIVSDYLDLLDTYPLGSKTVIPN